MNANGAPGVFTAFFSSGLRLAMCGMGSLFTNTVVATILNMAWRVHRVRRVEGRFLGRELAKRVPAG